MERHAKKKEKMYDNRIREVRLSCNLGLEEVAFKIGKASSTVSNWENGTELPSLQSALKLAQFYSMPIESLFPAETGSYSDMIDLSSLTAEEKGLVIQLVHMLTEAHKR